MEFNWWPTGPWSLDSARAFEQCPGMMPGLYLQQHRDPHRARLGRMKVFVRDPGSGFAFQAGRIEVADIVDLAVEEVQDIEADPHLLRHSVAELRIHERRGAGALRIVFDEGPRSEVAQSQSSVPRSLRIRQAARHRSGR